MKNKIIKSNFVSFHATSISQLIHGMGINKVLIFYLLPIYYLLTVFNALIDGVGILLLVNLFTGSSAGTGNSPLPNYILQVVNTMGGTVEFPNIIYLLVIVFGINLFLECFSNFRFGELNYVFII